MTTLHDLRVSLRDSMTKIEKLELEINSLRSELGKRNQALKELDSSMKKKDEVISMKDSIIKEKDNHIRRLEAELMSLAAPPSPNPSTSISPQQQMMQFMMQGGGNGAKASNGILTDATNFMSGDLMYNGLSSSQSSPLHYNKTKRIAISAEPAQHKFNKTKELRANLKKYPKSDQTKEFLTNAIFENDFMKNLESDQIENIVECMYPVEFAKNSIIIKEGDIGNIVYITQEGTVEVSKNSKVLCNIGSGRVFGELAILYNCTRTASIKALTNCKLWAIDRNMFQIIMMRSGIEKHDEYMELLKNIPHFKSLRDDVLVKLIDLIDEVTYANREFIVRQYAKGDTLFIISKGRVAVTKSTCKWDQAKFVKHLTRGDYFGENALFEEETRQFNVEVDDPNGVTCLVLDRQTYNQLLNDTTSESGSATTTKRTGAAKLYKRAQTTSHVMAAEGALDEEEEEELGLLGIRLAEFEIIGTLGVGGFGRVELVRNTRDQRTYALKVLKKQHVVETKQQDHVLNERNILIETRCNFICRLYKTFKDKKYLYLLLDACLGGELWTLLREKGSFEEQQTKFYTACVIEALAYLHNKGIVYRDLKPENLILSANGYCKLVDFGFAKKIGLGKKTWTFCGTPEYVAPEIILNKGHDVGADFWSLGVLIFELLTGNPPFVGTDPMNTYNIILKGIEAIDFPRKIPKITAVLIKRLCRENAVDRLGYQRGGIKDVAKHKWFEGFSWESLRSQTLEAPYIPIIKDNSDLSNFDKYPDDNDPEPMDDLTGWDFAF